ncbi:MAG TPA: adenylate/guanylate cyclase domain-containing protein [Roseiarcus sp.]|nr:adenylate/guanylate cyclase domain-containing protein [Roseiarcus sp.]
MDSTRKIAAILVADVVGFSRLAGADEDRTLARLRTLRSDLIDPTIALYNGRVFKRTGDGTLVEFRSVVDAVRCAIEVQNGLIERNAGLPPERRIDFRIGVHLGDVVEESDGDLMGDGVNIAARVQGLAAPGAICLSEDAYRQVRGRLDVAITDLGPRELKNIAEPVRVYSLEVGKPAKPKPMPNWRSALFAAVAAALAILVAAGGWRALIASRPVGMAPLPPLPFAAEPPPADRRFSIVVLPFANLSGDPAQDYLADALTDELTTRIARSPYTFVIARNTASTYKNKPVDAKAVGKDLGVRYVLEGSVQPSASQVRVNVQLIDADSGAHLWAEQFDTPRADVLQMQDEIVTRLAHTLQFELPEADVARLKRTHATNPGAQDLALQCLSAVRKTPEAASKEAAAGYRLCEQALAADPDNVLALLLLSIKYWQPVSHGLSADPQADLKRGDELVSKALALDPTVAYGHVFKAEILRDGGRYEEGNAEAERALDLDPTAVDAYAQMAFNDIELGRFKRSVENLDKAIRLSPHDESLHYWYAGKASAFFGLKEDDQAIEWARRSITIDPTYRLPHPVLIAALALTGRQAEAHEALQRYLALFPGGPGTMAAWKSIESQNISPQRDQHVLEYWDRLIEGLKAAGLPET